MNGTHLTLGLVGALAAAGALSRRGSRAARARDLFTDADSIQEWGYDPQPYTPIAQRDPTRQRWPGKFLPPTGSLNLAAVQRLRAALRASSGSANVIDEPKPRASRKKVAPQDAAVAEMLRLDPKDVPDELLVAVLLMGAVKGDPVKVARETLDELGGNLQRVLRAQAFDARGLEPLSRARMVATRELVRRANLRGVLAGDGPVLDSPDKVYDVARALSTGARERLTAMYLNNKNRVLGTREVSLGTHRYVLADPVQVFRPAVEMNARSVILVHNHPSGDASPSGPDYEVTRAMVSAGKVLQIAFLDHVIVTPTSQYSFKANGSIY
jgi:DNA repair protein RadC